MSDVRRGFGGIWCPCCGRNRLGGVNAKDVPAGFILPGGAGTDVSSMRDEYDTSLFLCFLCRGSC